MLSISVTTEWRAAHPGAAIGLLGLSGIENARGSRELDNRKRQAEARLRERYRGWTRHELLSWPVMAAYVRYYKRFGKTYHVLLQIESITLKGKDLPHWGRLHRRGQGRRPAGVPKDIVEAQLRLIEEHARLVSRSAVTEQRRVFVA